MVRRVLTPIALLAVLAGPAYAADHGCDGKLDAFLRQRAQAPAGVSQILVRTADGPTVGTQIRALGGLPGRFMPASRLQVARVPDAGLHALACFSHVESISVDRPVHGAVDRTAGTIGAKWVREQLGLDGHGIGIALIDSGITAQHDDLDTDRVAHFADFVNFRTGHYDDYGHGTHVAGIIAGNGTDSGGARIGVAPGASLVVLKALDGAGFGYTSNVIAALDFAIANRDKYNIRVINLSVAAGVYESFNKDPLTLAARRAVDAGIVVVAAAGNLGRSSLGKAQFGGIAAPGNAPWVLTVGASTHKGTIDRADDEVAGFSSRGPSAIDRSAKPDLVAPGVGIESITEPSSVLFGAHPNARLWGTVRTISQPYLSLSGTSMSAPIVAGTVALMLDANPKLTPNAVKAILQFTAENRDGVDARTQGAGFLNARGAVELARAFGEDAAPQSLSQEAVGDPVRWSRRLIWGNRRLSGGTITAQASAWQRGIVWGASTTPDGKPVVWGTLCNPADDVCTGVPWTSAAKHAPASGHGPGDDANEDTCDECAANLWVMAASDDRELVFAGSVSDPLAGADGATVETPAVKTGWPEGMILELTAAAHAICRPDGRRDR